jgi:hypothetical protein
MIHEEVHYCHSNVPRILLKCAPQTKRYYYVTLHFTGMIIIFLSMVNDSSRTHLFSTVRNVFTEYFEKIMQAYT